MILSLVDNFFLVKNLMVSVSRSAWLLVMQNGVPFLVLSPVVSGSTWFSLEQNAGPFLKVDIFW